MFSHPDSCQPCQEPMLWHGELLTTVKGTQQCQAPQQQIHLCHECLYWLMRNVSGGRNAELTRLVLLLPPPTAVYEVLRLEAEAAGTLVRYSTN